MPLKSVSIPRKIFYSAMSAKILRIRKTTTKLQDLKNYATILIGRIIKQGNLKNHVKKAPLKLFNSHEECFMKLRKNKDSILNNLL